MNHLVIKALNGQTDGHNRCNMSPVCEIVGWYGCVQNLVQDDRKVLATVVENSDSEVTRSTTQKLRDEVVSDRKSRDGGNDDVTSVSVQSRSYSDSGGNMSHHLLLPSIAVIAECIDVDEAHSKLSDVGLRRNTTAQHTTKTGKLAII